MVVTVVMTDAVRMMPKCQQEMLSKHTLAELLYADDTLLLGVSAVHVEKFLAAVESSGANFGLKLHADKFHLLCARCTEQIRHTDGKGVCPEEELRYLGASISDDGRIQTELGRRLGMAHADFRALSKLWHHASLSRARKVQVFNATFVSKLMYGLATAWLNTCLLYTSPSPRDATLSRMPSSA